ncbi:MAG: hypothetical protein DMG32_16080 [Acidobacteria bacterium]|nr:MAG: hypothetical protein DMG32_16080 [Acidobacteriota bacterium]
MLTTSQARQSPGNGDGTFTRVATSLNSIFALGVAVGDFNGDGKLDIAFFGLTIFSKFSVRKAQPRIDL